MLTHPQPGSLAALLEPLRGEAEGGVPHALLALNADGRAPLHVAVLTSRGESGAKLEAVQMLLQLGAADELPLPALQALAHGALHSGR